MATGLSTSGASEPRPELAAPRAADCTRGRWRVRRLVTGRRASLHTISRRGRAILSAMEFSRPPGAGASVAGRYLIEEVLGRGGMATVYLALDQHTGQRCALKRGSGIGSRKTRRRVEL